MKKIGYLLIVLMLGMLASCGSPSNRADRARAKYVSDSIALREKFIKDSIDRAEFVKDSIERSVAAAKLAPRFNIKKDEFSDKIWVKPKSAPQYTNRNAFYCYFCIINGIPQNLRLRYQYYANDWLFIKSMIFNIDGENIQIIPDMETDHGGGMIWEWFDEKVYYESAGRDIKNTEENRDLKVAIMTDELMNQAFNKIEGVEVSAINKAFIEKLVGAKVIKIKLNGSKYYNVVQVTKDQIQAIKDVYDYFNLLGGTLEPKN